MSWVKSTYMGAVKSQFRATWTGCGSKTNERAALERGCFYTAGWVFPKRRRTGVFWSCISQFLWKFPLLKLTAQASASLGSGLASRRPFCHFVTRPRLNVVFSVLFVAGGIEPRCKYLFSALHRWLHHNWAIKWLVADPVRAIQRCQARTKSLAAERHLAYTLIEQATQAIQQVRWPLRPYIVQ